MLFVVLLLVGSSFVWFRFYSTQSELCDIILVFVLCILYRPSTVLLYSTM